MTPETMQTGINLWPVVTAIIGSLTPITIAVIVFGFKISGKLTRLETKEANHAETHAKLERQPMPICFRTFTTQSHSRRNSDAEIHS